MSELHSPATDIMQVIIFEQLFKYNSVTIVDQVVNGTVKTIIRDFERIIRMYFDNLP